jgi:diaminohydroxyphosphoribosylaminopyrimidine deaminase/5-amino-6-(5-phosphoribosylamino)uracil reductase
MTARQVPTVIVTAAAPADRQQALRGLGCEVLSLPGGDGRVDIPALLDEMGRRRWTNLLVEGGSGVLGSFRDVGAIDEVHVFIAPRLAGGTAAATAVGGHGVERIAEALPLSRWSIEEISGDCYVHGWTEEKKA